MRKLEFALLEGGRFLVFDAARFGALEDVLLLLWDVIEHLGWETEVL